MENSLHIKIESDTEEDLYKILHHVVREITQGPIQDFDELLTNYRVEGDMLKLDNDLVQGGYSWSRS
jgi:hypothetical protein